MPAALPDPVRQDIWARAQQGHGPTAIADPLKLSARTVRRLLAHFRTSGGSIPPAYHRCARPPKPDIAHWREPALALRRLHPAWGARRILTQLRQTPSGRPLPGRATVCRWLARAGLAPVRLPPAPPAAARAREPHQVWQIDAAERTPLRTGEQVSWLRVVDEASGAVLGSRAFAQGRFAEVGAAAVQEALRALFGRWGRPDALRVDNGTPWVDPGTLPSALELWLAGLGVALRRNPPRRPQANGVVERSQRTARAWAEPGRCDGVEQLQRRLDEEDVVQRQEYRLDGGRTRLEAWPALAHSGRGFVAGAWEEYFWDLAGALACLAGYALTRKVNKDGDVSLYDRHHRASKALAGELVQARLDAASIQWVFSRGGEEVGRAGARYLSAESIRGLSIAGRPGRSAARTRARRSLRPQAGDPAALHPPDSRPGQT
jgi:hypothetical protein